MKALRRAVRFASLLLGVYLVTVVATVALAEWSTSDLRSQLDELRHSGQLTTATITSFEPHNGVCYTFFVSGTPYSACHGNWYDEPNGQRVGGPIHVVYDPANPSVSCSCDPGSEYYSRTVGPFGLGLVIGVMGVIVFLWLRQWWKKTAPAQSNPGGR